MVYKSCCGISWYLTHKPVYTGNGNTLHCTHMSSPNSPSARMLRGRWAPDIEQLKYFLLPETKPFHVDYFDSVYWSQIDKTVKTVLNLTASTVTTVWNGSCYVIFNEKLYTHSEWTISSLFILLRTQFSICRQTRRLEVTTALKNRAM